MIALDSAKSADAQMRILKSSSIQEWTDTLSLASVYDFYHTSSYHAMAEERGEGEARMFVHKEGGYMIALPLLLRPIMAQGPAAFSRGDWKDATSVYGYAGPICSHDRMPKAVAQNFQSALRGELSKLGVVAVFSRLHPLILQQDVLSGMGVVRGLGETVSISLHGSEAEQKAHYRDNHKRGIAKLKQLGVECIEDEQKRALGEFAKLYTATMRRVGAQDLYFFDDSYFRRLCEGLGSQCHLFLAWLNGKAVAGGLFVQCGDILQYHLGASHDDFLKLAPMKVVFDSVREWGSARGLSLLHLGGGVGCSEDSLFQFKAGFSKNRHRCACWQWVVNEEVYSHFCGITSADCAARNLKPASAQFFPAYRSQFVAAN